ncbi:hypothetical protein [Bacillus cereus]|uniref:hypothetical protein n=1 Tax=Bacillus cereus TaxID=1396 RepID=UPI003A8ADCDE
MDNIHSKDYTKRALLTVKNNTKTLVEDGKSLYLEWSGDTNTREPLNCIIEVGQNCKKDSKGIGDGWNCRTFTVKVYKRNINRPHTYIGEFNHSVASTTNPGSEETSIYAIYGEDEIGIYRRWMLTHTCPKTPPIGIDNPHETIGRIGSISYEEWENE